MRRFVFLLMAVIFLTFSSGAKAEVKYFVKTAKAFIGDNQTKNDARMLATLEAKRMALEEAGTYVESLTIVKNAMVAKDEILAFTAGVAKTEILEERPLIEGESFGIEVKAKVTVDTSILAERIKRLREDRELLENNKQLINRNKDLEEELKQLRAELDRAKDRSEVKELQKKTEVFQERYTATEWFEKGYNADDLDKKIVYYSKAIELDPDFAEAYNNRGSAYKKKGEQGKAIRDYNKAIELKPNFAVAYYNRGTVYGEKGEQDRAIRDFNKAIELNPDYAKAYNNRGAAYWHKGEYERAKEDYRKACELGYAPACSY